MSTDIPHVQVENLGRHARLVVIPANCVPVLLCVEDENGQLYEYKFGVLLEPGSGGSGENSR